MLLSERKWWQKLLGLGRQKHKFDTTQKVVANAVWAGTGDPILVQTPRGIENYKAVGYTCLLCGETYFIDASFLNDMGGDMRYCGYKQLKENK
jgi:hypothetical protein